MKNINLGGHCIPLVELVNCGVSDRFCYGINYIHFDIYVLPIRYLKDIH
jgi:hypothetical protein